MGKQAADYVRNNGIVKAVENDVVLSREGASEGFVERSEMGSPNAFAYKKKVIPFPLRHPQYDEALSRYGSLYPQAFCIDPVADEILFVSATGQITVFVWSTRRYKKTFVCPITLVSENAIVKYVDGERRLYLRGNNAFQYYNITITAQWQELTPAWSTPIVAQRNFAEHAGEWLITNNNAIPLGQNRSRGYFAVYDDAFTQIGSIYLSPLQCGINEGVPHEGAISKMQGMDFDGANIYLGMGGFWDPATANKRYGAYGVRIMRRDGGVSGDYLLHPEKLLARLKELGHNPAHVENEGVQVVKQTGSVYSLLVGSAHATDPAVTTKEGLYILQEFCPDADADDFSGCATTISTFSELYRSSALYPRDLRGFVNPLTQTVFATWKEIIDYMRSVDMSEFRYYSSTFKPKDFNGAEVVAGCDVTIKNGNNSTFLIKAESYNYLAKWRISGDVQTPSPTNPA